LHKTNKKKSQKINNFKLLKHSNTYTNKIMKSNALLKTNATIEMTNLNEIKEKEFSTLDHVKDPDKESTTSRQRKATPRKGCLSKLKTSICKRVPKCMKTLLFLIICLVICNILLIGVTAYGLAMGLMSTKSLVNNTSTQTPSLSLMQR